MTSRFLHFCFLLALLSSCKNDPAPIEPQGVYVPPAPIIGYTKTAVFPHDTNAFTEGLLVHKGQLFESTGSPENFPLTQSLFGIVDLNTGKINVKAQLDRKKFFGEGIVILGDKIYQLTYQTKVGFVYDLASFKRTGEFTFPSAEGWGMTTDSTSIIMSDGTSILTYLNPADFSVTKTLAVTENGNPVNYLNELEYIKGYLYANVWMTNTIVKIDPQSGKILGRLDLYELANDANAKNPQSAEMNGIAWDAEKDKVYVTGKMWPSIYEVKFDW